ncbi:unnamed protein product [Durusdinium trenchii]|uniref:Uncharacterized protein n=1 Tax=Durusdinium trenchii TaxID=1381693 RepID=A0ABP0RS46_9DINO
MSKENRKALRDKAKLHGKEIVKITVSKSSNKVHEPPPECWRFANLEPMVEFINSAVQSGRYTPDPDIPIQASSHSSEDRFDFDRELEKVRQRVAKASAVVEDAPEITMEYVAEIKPKVIEWISMGEHEIDKANGDDVGYEHFSRILEVHRQQELVKMEIQKATKTFEQQSVSIEKAKSQMLAKWSGSIGVSDPRAQKLDEWAAEKKKDAYMLVTKHSDELKRLESLVDSHIFQLLQLIAGHDQKHTDPECDALVQELDLKFQAMFLEEPPPTSTPNTPVEMSVERAALEKIRELPDGPQKSALLAVLEAAVAKEAKTLHEQYKDDPDAIFQPDGTVKFIGPRGVEEDESQHLARLAHNARMRFNRQDQMGSQMDRMRFSLDGAVRKKDKKSPLYNFLLKQVSTARLQRSALARGITLFGYGEMNVNIGKAVMEYEVELFGSLALEESDRLMIAYGRFREWTRANRIVCLSLFNMTFIRHH